MKKLYKLFLLTLFFQIYPAIAIDENWMNILTRRYISLSDNVEYKDLFNKSFAEAGSSRQVGVEQIAKTQLLNHTIPTILKVELYSYYMFSGEYCRFDNNYRTLLVMLLLKYDESNPQNPVYMLGRSQITNMAGKLLVDFLPHDEPEFMDIKLSYEDNMRKYLDDFVLKSIATMPYLGINTEDIAKIASKYNHN